MNKQPVRIVQGTTNSFSINVIDDDGVDYTLTDSEKLFMGIKYDTMASEPAVIKEAVSSEDGAYVVTLDPADTEGLTPGRYFYDVSLQSGDDLYNIIELSAFDIIPGVTKWRAPE